MCSYFIAMTTVHCSFEGVSHDTGCVRVSFSGDVRHTLRNTTRW